MKTALLFLVALAAAAGPGEGLDGGWGSGEGKRELLSFQVGKRRKFWGLVSQQCEYTSNYCTIHLEMVKMVNFMLCVLYNN